MNYLGGPIPKSCLDCRYRRPASSALPGETICHFMLDTGVSRGCPVERCRRWRGLAPTETEGGQAK